MQKITLEVIHERLNNLITDNKDDHEKIIAQTTKTNGTVIRHDQWINKAKGALTVIEIILVPLILYVGYNILSKFF